jgi:hypothetical protein
MMSRILTSILMIGSIGYLGYKYKYRLINVLLGSRLMRRFAVGSIMSFPGIKQKMMQSMFGRPSEW